MNCCRETWNLSVRLLPGTGLPGRRTLQSGLTEGGRQAKESRDERDFISLYFIRSALRTEGKRGSKAVDAVCDWQQLFVARS